MSFNNLQLRSLNAQEIIHLIYLKQNKMIFSHKIYHKSLDSALHLKEINIYPICADLYFFRGWGGGGLTEYFNSRGGGGGGKITI